jgi:hypothetical protein
MIEPDAAVDWLQQLQQQRARDAEEGRQAFASACDRLRELGIAQLRVVYDGYGDSGTIEQITATDGSGEPVELPEGFQDVLDEAACCLLPAGWDINEGAFGEFVLNVPNRRLTREHNWRIESTEYEEEEYTL